MNSISFFVILILVFCVFYLFGKVHKLSKKNDQIEYALLNLTSALTDILNWSATVDEFILEVKQYVASLDEYMEMFMDRDSEEFFRTKEDEDKEKLN